MEKISHLFLLILSAISLLAFYEALFPVSAIVIMTRFLGLSAFFLLCLSLILGPLALLKPSSFGQWLPARRAVGIAAFIFLAMHFILAFMYYFTLELDAIFASLKYLVVLPALLIFAAMAITSFDSAIKKMGFSRWKLLQRLSYFAFVLSIYHFYLTANGLFVPLGSKVFLNLAELALFILAVFTIVLQFMGFFAMRNKKKR